MIEAETRQRIEDFLLDCAWAIDEDELEAWPGFFAGGRALPHHDARQ